MALTFGAATSDRVSITNTATIQLDATSVVTWLVWFMVTTFTAGRNILSKNASDGNGGPILRLDGTQELNYRFGRATTNDTATTNNSAIATNTWYCVAATRDPGDSQFVRIYLGSLTSALTERGYASSANGSGTSSSTANLTIGNVGDAAPTLAVQGRIAVAMHFNRHLSQGELQALQFQPRIVSGCVVLSQLGFTGTSTQPDWSGNGHAGTVTGASVADHVPLRSPWGCDREWMGIASQTYSGRGIGRSVGRGIYR